MEKYLLGTCGNYNRQKIPIKEEIIMGRDSGVCQLVFGASESEISGVHCKIQNIDGVIQLTDMGSTNGTFLETGVRLTPYEPQMLTDGQGFFLGSRGNSFVLKEEGKGGELQALKNKPKEKNEQESKGIGISIAALVAGILAVIAGIGAIYIESAIWVAFVSAVVGLGLGAVARAIHLKGKNMALSAVICSAAVVVVLVGSIIYSTLKPQTLAGNWTCPAVNEVVDGLTRGVESGLSDAGMDSQLAGYIVDEIGLNDELVFRFAENGDLYLSKGDGDISIGTSLLSWEDLQDGHVMLTLDLSGIQIFGVSAPIKIGYNAAYKIKGKKLTLDFFGTEIELERK